MVDLKKKYHKMRCNETRNFCFAELKKLKNKKVMAKKLNHTNAQFRFAYLVWISVLNFIY